MKSSLDYSGAERVSWTRARIVTVERPKKRLNAKTRKRCITNKRKARERDQLDTNHDERKSKSLFRMHNETNKRKERDWPVEKMTRKKTKNVYGCTMELMYIHPH